MSRQRNWQSYGAACKLVKDSHSAATRLMCDLIRLQSGSVTIDEIRKHWAKGQYAGAPEAWALEVINYAKRQKN